jgi:hypothetical protein
MGTPREERAESEVEEGEGTEVDVGIARVVRLLSSS